MPAAKQNFRIDDLWVNVYDSDAELAKDAAAIASEYLSDVIKQQGMARVLLATGNSQLKFLDALISLGNLDWSKITCFHLDEYLGISGEHPGSFRRYLREKVEKRVNPDKFHYIEGDTLEPLAECVRYSQLLQLKSIDLCLLGIGDNGHLAFNDPAVANFQDTHYVKLVKLDEINRQQQLNSGDFTSLENVPQYAFTVTIPMICQAKKIICLAPGKRKAEIIQQMLQGAITSNCPASILRNTAQTTLFLDADSSSLSRFTEN
ncbi:glucosamine-6-phosphate deaminase [Calothrix sp. PCC 6303]|uniref:glucosamine-6-phosphate deaminase n=1 Tax=Calothrix sp. PCC 6303 TaxID=1170562 RepID=UPI0002A014C2|nr:glucosamine-6-phosphate deaminase [Calothrix sp. PCC 6303]AFZ00337.1 Glucosamine-6-phosphate deaminase [Calothrix sp. PCC 6303]